MNLQILNRNIPKKQLNVYPKTVKKVTSVQVVYKCISDSSGWCTTGAVRTAKY